MSRLEAFHDDVIAGRGGVLATLARGPLWLASWGYRGIIATRNARYDGSSGAVQRVAAPVISVGNITTGGTGKTPVVIDLVKRLQRRGAAPAVVARGYRAAAGLADELAEVQSAAPGVVTVADPDRVRGAARAIDEHGADVVVLDDGFQHRRIHRDLDIVLIDATRPFGGGHLLPRGALREPVASLGRADMVLITRRDQVDVAALADLRARLRCLTGERPVLVCRHQPGELRRLDGALADADGPAMLVSGIARPAAFERTVADLGIEVCAHLRFADHHAYTAADVRDIQDAKTRCAAARIITTEKDAVKLPSDLDAVQVLPVAIAYDEGDEQRLDALLVAVIEPPTGGPGST